MAKSTRLLLDDMAGRFANANSATAKKSVATIKSAAAILDSLVGIRAPINKQAETEQRNDAWRKAAIRSAFSGKVTELARMRHDLDAVKRTHAAARPTIPPIDKTDMLAAMETIELARRVATTPPDRLHTLTPHERMAALRVPTLAKLTPAVAEVWHDQIVGADRPDELEVWKANAEAITEAGNALTMANTSLRDEVGLPAVEWVQFEREATQPVRDELHELDVQAARRRVEDAEAELRRAESNAQFRSHREEIALLKAL